MNIILKKRIKLIRAMLDAKSNFVSYNTKLIISSLIDKIRNDEGGFFLSLSLDDPNKVSYVKKENDKYNDKIRVKTTLQRFVRRQLDVQPLDISDAVLDRFATLTMLFLDDSLDDKVKIYTGIKIAEFYTGTNIKSCMTGGCNSYKTSLYEANPDKVGLAIFNNEVRALIWRCDDGNVVLDRAYPSGHWGISFIRAWAKKKGFLIRNNADSVSDGKTNGISDGKNHIVTLKHEGIFPYMDTFKYGIFIGDRIMLSNNQNFGSVVLTNTDGLYYNREVCCACGIPTNDSGVYARDNGFF